MENEKIKNFIESLNLPRYIADVLFETWSDCVLFLKSFYNRNLSATDDVLDFREHKISQSKIVSSSLFVKECEDLGMKIAFEKTFYQSFSNEEINMFEKSINLGKLSLKSLFNSFKKNPNRNILKYAL